MHRPRCSAKLPNKCGCTSPITRSGSILIRAGPGAPGWAASLGGLPATMTAAVRPSNQRCRIMDSTPSAEFLPAEDAVSLADHDELVRFDAADRLGGAVGPPDRQLGGGRGAQPEVQPAVVHGVEARLRRDLLRLRAAAVAGDDPRADRAAVGLDADEPHLQPVATAGDVVAQQ